MTDDRLYPDMRVSLAFADSLACQKAALRSDLMQLNNERLLNTCRNISIDPQLTGMDDVIQAAKNVLAAVDQAGRTLEQLKARKPGQEELWAVITAKTGITPGTILHCFAGPEGPFGDRFVAKEVTLNSGCGRLGLHEGPSLWLSGPLVRKDGTLGTRRTSTGVDHLDTLRALLQAGTEIAAPTYELAPVEELQLAVDSEHPAFLERTRFMFAQLRRLADSTPAGILKSLRLEASEAQGLRAHVRLEMTSKGNLSVEWYPHDQAMLTQMQVSASMGYYRPDRLQLLRDARELFDSPYYMARRCKTPLQVRQGHRLWRLLLQYFVEAVEGYIGKLGSVIDVVRAGPTLSIVEEGCDMPHLQLNYPAAAATE